MPAAPPASSPVGAAATSTAAPLPADAGSPAWAARGGDLAGFNAVRMALSTVSGGGSPMGRSITVDSASMWSIAASCGLSAPTDGDFASADLATQERAWLHLIAPGTHQAPAEGEAADVTARRTAARTNLRLLAGCVARVPMRAQLAGYTAEELSALLQQGIVQALEASHVGPGGAPRPATTGGGAPTPSAAAATAVVAAATAVQAQQPSAAMGFDLSRTTGTFNDDTSISTILASPDWSHLCKLLDGPSSASILSSMPEPSPQPSTRGPAGSPARARLQSMATEGRADLAYNMKPRSDQARDNRAALRQANTQHKALTLLLRQIQTVRETAREPRSVSNQLGSLNLWRQYTVCVARTTPQSRTIRASMWKILRQGLPHVPLCDTFIEVSQSATAEAIDDVASKFHITTEQVDEVIGWIETMWR
eukprot:COSAG01_NODE_1804_length_9192_cov_31.006049_2_plen_424_part_00